MAASFKYTEPQQRVETRPRKVLVTGAAGRIGSSFAEYAHQRYPLCLLVHHADSAEKVKPYGKVVAGELGDLTALCCLFSGMDTIVHLAADPSPHAEWESVSCIVLRIGAFQPREKAREADSVGTRDVFVSHRDLNQLICRSIDDTKLQYALFHGLSNNRCNRMDITTARQLLGYEPQDDFTHSIADCAH